MFDFKILFAIIFIIISDESRYEFLFGGPTVDIQNNWWPIETAQRFSKDFPKIFPNHSGQPQQLLYVQSLRNVKFSGIMCSRANDHCVSSYLVVRQIIPSS
jgi:hypothetical protein